MQYECIRGVITIEARYLVCIMQYMTYMQIQLGQKIANLLALIKWRQMVMAR